jgi:nitrogen fixation/metabolism regulation signal transduction histidine kinase
VDIPKGPTATRWPSIGAAPAAMSPGQGCGVSVTHLTFTLTTDPMTGNSEVAHVLTVGLLGMLLLIGVLATVAYLVGGSAQDLVPSRTNVSRAIREARFREQAAARLTLRHVLGFGLLAAAPMLLAAAVLFVAVQRPTNWYWWLISGVVLAVGLLVLSDVVGPPVADGT